MLKLCKICGSKKDVFKNKTFKDLLCSKHREQIRKYGEIRKRTTSDKNEFIKKNGYFEIVIFDRYQNKKGISLIDINDYKEISKYKWCIGGGYVHNSKLGTLHKFLLGKKKGLEIDHINRDKLDNRRKNLRFVDKSENNRNIGAKNVYKTRSGKFEVSLYKKYKRYYFGTYSDEHRAIKKAKEIQDHLYKGGSIESYIETL